MTTKNFQVRDLHKLEPDRESEGVHDILFYGADGVVRYSENVYESSAEAEKAKAELEANGEIPDWWDICTAA